MVQERMRDTRDTRDTRATEDDVVITGISGRLPESENIEEFRQHLINGDDMVTDDDRRWQPGLNGLPTRSGKLKDLSQFDASFFGVHPKQANSMDPQLRMLLEVTYEAIVDAGMNPQEVRGTKTGVFIGCSASESHEVWTFDMEKIVGYEMTGCTRSMFANRLSFFFDFKGPSYATDTACSSSLLALDQALHAIRSGQCDAAIVGGTSLCLKPHTTLQFQRLGMLSPRGACRSFDASGDGYCRSEAVVAVYLQKASAAKRIYATFIHSKTNSDGNKERGITFPSGEVQKSLLLEVYKEAGVDPSEVAYVEAHGTGTKAGDPQEVNTVTDVFCSNGRKGPLLIGSTKSNMGHPEPASGLAALAKVLIAMEDGAIPANLHFTTPNPDIPGLSDGRLKVVTERTAWNGGYIAINSFGFGGSNVHALMHSNTKPPAPTHAAANAQRLCMYAGRTQQGLENTLTKMRTEHAHSVEAHALLQETAAMPASSHPYRGYTILNKEPAVQEVQQYASTEKRPVWFVFAGMGTQWHGMGRDLMELDVFRQSIMESDAVLQPYGVKLYDLLMTGEEDAFNDTLNSFVGIAATQVALVCVLKVLGIKPDGIVGHSVGELGCAYADGGLTAEETVLAAYWRGRCVMEANLPLGGMAAVGLTWEEAKERCPSGVVPACHNSIDTVTISGPAETISEFVSQLKEEGVFAKEVKSAGVAFHSHYMQRTAPALKAALLKVIKENRVRTPRWVSSSIPEERWDTDLAKFSSADYHVNNLVSPVLFQEALQHVPAGAVLIEIAPHCLLQAILKRSLSADCLFVGLMKRNHADNVEYLLSSLGKVYMAGVNFNPLGLYPAVKMPVSRGTPMLSSLVQWDHEQPWDVPKAEQFITGPGGSGSSISFEIDASAESEDNYLVGHKIDGRVLYPATGYLVLVWRAFAKINRQSYEQFPVAFEDVQIHRATIMPKTGIVKLDVSIMPGTGMFELCEGGTLVVSGRVFQPSDPVIDLPVCDPTEKPQEAHLIRLTSGDVYKQLRLRGYDYGPTFQGILSASHKGDDGYLVWRDNWVTFLDTMLQIQILSAEGSGLRLPTRIRSIRIDPATHADCVIQADSEHAAVRAQVDHVLDACVAGGAQIVGLHATVAPRHQQQTAPVLEKFEFIPYNEDNVLADRDDLSDYSRLCKACIRRGLVQLLDNGVTEHLPNVDLFKQQLAKMKIDDVADIDATIEKLANDPKCVLATTLRQIFSQEKNDLFVENIRNMLASLRGSLARDKLLGSASTDRMLKTCLDVVLENRGSTKLKVMEYGAGDSRVYQQAIPQLESQPMMQVDYTAIDTNAKNFDADHLESFNVTSVEWTLSGSPPGQLGTADVTIACNVLHKEADLATAISWLGALVKDSGFLLVQEPTTNFVIPLMLDALANELKIVDADKRTCGPFCDAATWTTLLESAGLEVVAQKSDGFLNTLFLCRKCAMNASMQQQTTIDVSSVNFEWVEEVKNVLVSADDRPAGHNVWLKADRSNNGIIGMVNCLRQEPGGDKVRCIFDGSLDQNKPMPALEGSVFESLVHRDLVMNIYRDGKWGSFRHIPLHKDGRRVTKHTEHAYVNVLTRGDLSSLKWIESPLKYFAPADHRNKELCSVYYTSLNFRDIMLATGKLPPDAIPGDIATKDCILGMEFSGRNPAGNRIMGLLAAKGLASSVDADRRFIWPVPDHWTLEQAASVPVVYSTVYYALVVRGRIKKGDRVLIHSGSGGVGQAAISVALHRGCEVFTTVGSKEKREYLKQRFPQLEDSHFANSRDKSFEWDILRATGGKGVNVVLNSLAEEKLQASVRLLAPHGQFLEIGKFDLSNDSRLGMALFLRNVTFHGILLDALFEEGNADWGPVAALVSEGIAAGAVQPLNTTVFDKNDIEEAFRYMAQGKHIGKVVVKVREEEKERVVLPTRVLIDAIPRTTCHPHKSYVITGGLGGFGLELASWLVDRGATRLVLTSRSGVRTGYQCWCIEQWRRSGVNVKVSTCNVKCRKETDELIREAMAMGPIGGVFHLAMVLQDGFMENQTREMFQKVGETKVAGTVNLDETTRRQCSSSLDWFVVFSSVSCGRGNAGQANYGFSNSFMERICEQRMHDGYPGLAVQWGAVGDVGIVLDTMGGNDTVVGGTLPQRITSCLAALDQFLNLSQPVVSSLVLAEKQSKGKGDTSDRTSLVSSVAHILGIKDPSTTNPVTTLADLGLDSLMGVEVKQMLERDYDLVLPMKDIRQLTINKLNDIMSGTAAADMSKTGSVGDAASTQMMNDSGVSIRYDLSHVMPAETIIPMNEQPTDANSQPWFVMHSIEGVVLPLEAVMFQVKAPVYGLQCTADAPLTSVPDLAAFYIKVMKQVQPQPPYKLIGYSFGACIAFEMALQLQKEAEDAVKALTLLDGSHLYVASHTAQYKAKFTEGKRDEESEALVAFITQFTLVDYTKMSSKLQSQPDWKARLNVAIDYLFATNQFTNRSELEMAAESFYKKLVIADKYKPDAMLSRPVLLITASSRHNNQDAIGTDYGLSKVCSAPVSMETVEGDHESFILGKSALKVADIINKSLSTNGPV